MRIRGAAVVSFSSYKVRENWDTGLLATLCLELVSAPFCFEREETTWPHCLQSSPYPNSPTLLMLESHTSPNHTHTVCPLLVNISLHSYLVFVQYLHGFWDHEVSVLLSGVLEEFSRAFFQVLFQRSEVHYTVCLDPLFPSHMAHDIHRQNSYKFQSSSRKQTNKNPKTKQFS